jgi:hypothetical protein
VEQYPDEVELYPDEVELYPDEINLSGWSEPTRMKRNYLRVKWTYPDEEEVTVEPSGTIIGWGGIISGRGLTNNHVRMKWNQTFKMNWNHLRDEWESV